MRDRELQEWGLRMAAEHSIPEPNTGCWLWLGADCKGYPTASRRNLTTRITRAVLGLPRLRQVDIRSHHMAYACHRCDTPLCVNPDHLFVGTGHDNQQDCSRKGRTASQQKTHCPRGHLLSSDNLRRRRDGYRDCRLCGLERDRLAYQARRARLGRTQVRVECE